MSRTTSYASGSEFSTSVIARASARFSPARTPAASDSRVKSRRAAMRQMLDGALLSLDGSFGGLRLERRLGGCDGVRDPDAGAAGEAEAGGGGEGCEARRRGPDPARADRLGQPPGQHHPEREKGDVRAHQNSEGTPTKAVGRAALD